MDIEYRMAGDDDLQAIVAFVDYWLTGGAVVDKVPGATHDYFVRVGQQKSYLRKYGVLLALYEGAIVGWAVLTKKRVLIHMLIAAPFRGQGIGKEMLRKLNPAVVRSKYDQKSGDPAVFYRKQGYVKQSSTRVGKKKNIDIFVKEDDVDEVKSKSKRTIDAVASKFKRVNIELCDEW